MTRLEKCLTRKNMAREYATTDDLRKISLRTWMVLIKWRFFSRVIRLSGGSVS